MARPPSQKGTSVLPVVTALKQHPDCRRLLPERLWKYLDEHIVVGGWYPEQDYWVLIDALVKTIGPKVPGGDAWRFFARYSAKADIGGVTIAADGSAAATNGVYRNFAAIDAQDTEALFRRAVRLWGQYHDTGAMEIRGGRSATNSLIMRLVGFHIPVEGFVRLQGYYIEEFGRLVGQTVVSKVRRSTASGDSLCEWEFVLERTPSAEAFVASLPPVAG